MANGYSHVSLFNAAPYNHGQINANLGSPADSIGETSSVMQFFRQCLDPSITDIEDRFKSKNNIRLFPNPANNQLTISDMPDGFTGTVSIYNTVGQVLSTEHRHESQFSVETGSLKKGIYLLQIRSGSGKVITRKFVRQ